MGNYRAFVILYTVSLVNIGCEDAKPVRTWQPSDHVGYTQGSPPPVQQPTQMTAEATIGRVLWQRHCTGCHGDMGQGKGTMTPPGAIIPNFSEPSWQKRADEASLHRIIKEGKNLMPAFGTQLSKTHIKALVQHIRRLSPPPSPSATP